MFFACCRDRWSPQPLPTVTTKPLGCPSRFQTWPAVVGYSRSCRGPTAGWTRSCLRAEGNINRSLMWHWNTQMLFLIFRLLHFFMSRLWSFTFRKGEIVSELPFDLLTHSFAMFSFAFRFSVVVFDVLSFDPSGGELIFPAEACWRSRLVIATVHLCVVEADF